MIAIVDYGMGNVGSIRNMLRKIGAEAVLTADPSVIRSAGRLILPGVGAFDTGMGNLEASGLLSVLRESVLERGTPVLGICLGMQLLARGSEEGTRPGLGWIAARTRRFAFGSDGPGFRVPHMGWNTAEVIRPDPLFEGLREDARFYFVHSYHVECENEEDVLARTSYGGPFVSAVRRGPVMGVQFHPEKSHRFGMQLLGNFAGLGPDSKVMDSGGPRL